MTHAGPATGRLRYTMRPVTHGFPHMIVLEGQTALSPFRRERLEARLRALHPTLRLLDSRYIYWVQPQPGHAPDMATLGRDTEKLVLSKALKLVFNDRVFIQDNRTVVL